MLKFDSIANKRNITLKEHEYWMRRLLHSGNRLKSVEKQTYMFMDELSLSQLFRHECSKWEN
jgi:hypothetical protein